jgi:hypothetical protein
MPQSVNLKVKGLVTEPNNLGSVPDGALIEADNIVINADDVAEPRRGFKTYANSMGNATSRAKQLLVYQKRLIRHYANVLQYDSNPGGTFTSYSGTYSEPDTNLKIRGVEINGNFYMTTSSGIKKLDQIDTAIQNPGGKIALDTEASISTGISGFLQNNNQVAYRVVWGFKDRNNNLILGAPSNRVVVGLGINELLANNFNTLRTKLDTAAPVSLVDELSDTNYASTITALNTNDTAATFNARLKQLATKIENDLNYITQARYGRNGSVSSISAASNALVTTSAAHGMQSGDKVVLAGTNSIPQLVGEYTVTVASPTTFTIPVTTTVAGTAAGTWASGIQRKYPVPTENNQPDYLQQQEFFDEIVATLNDEPTVKIATAAQTAGNFLISEKSRNVDVNFTIPEGITTDHFYQIYRSAQSGGLDIDPGDELQLVLEDNPTSTQITNKLVTVTDITPDDFRGADLYTNPNQEGIQQANQPPPFAKDIGIYKNSLFYANTKTPHFLNISMVSADTFTSSSTITFTSGLLNFTITFNAIENAPSGVVKLPDPLATPAQQVDETARSLVKVINRYTANIFLYASYESGVDDVPGLIRIFARNLDTAAFHLNANSTATGDEFSPAIPVTGNANISDNEVKPNRIYFSKFQQPEAVPTPNYRDIGGKDSAILRIVPLRDSLFVFKEDGIYRIIGDSVFSLSDSLFDNSTILVAPESVAVGNNQIYMLADQGIVRVSDTGSSIVSSNIEDKITPLFSPLFTNFKKATFGLYYTTARQYHLWTVEQNSDVNATQCYVFNTVTNAWTRFPIEKTCGIVNSADDKLYLGAGDTNFIEQERKSYTYRDFADREYTTNITAANGKLLTLTILANLKVGDMFTQTVYLTPFKFNTLLAKLDTDPGVASSDFVSTLIVTTKSQLRTKLNQLAQKLDTDGLQFTNYYSSMSLGTTPTAIQSDFNIIVNKLNIDSVVAFNNYQTSSSTTQLETNVIEINTTTSTITVENELDWDVASATFYNHILTRVTWAPQHSGDPSILKQYYEANLMFSSIESNRVDLSFRSDLLYGFQKVEFQSNTAGGWGNIEWGNDSWGSVEEPRAFRTYVPREKQKCRFLEPRFEHKRAFEGYRMVGLSLTFDPIIQRVNR